MSCGSAAAAAAQAGSWCGGTTRSWASPASLAPLPNTVCKLSGLVTEADWHSWTIADLAPYTGTVLEAFSPGRVMFGSDWPVCRLVGGYGRVLRAARAMTSGLGAAGRAEVFAGTARRVYGLR